MAQTGCDVAFWRDPAQWCMTGEGLLTGDVRTRERAYPFGRS